MTHSPRGAPWYIGLAYGSIVGFLAGFTLAGMAAASVPL
jgi:hypothetical protein